MMKFALIAHLRRLKFPSQIEPRWYNLGAGASITTRVARKTTGRCDALRRETGSWGFPVRIVDPGHLQFEHPSRPPLGISQLESGITSLSYPREIEASMKISPRQKGGTIHGLITLWDKSNSFLNMKCTYILGLIMVIFNSGRFSLVMCEHSPCIYESAIS